MMDEGTYVLSQAGVTNSDTLLQTVRDSTIRDVEKHKKHPYLDYWADIPDAMIETLRNSYRWEIGLFQYPDTPFTDVWHSLCRRLTRLTLWHVWHSTISVSQFLFSVHQTLICLNFDIWLITEPWYSIFRLFIFIYKLFTVTSLLPSTVYTCF